MTEITGQIQSELVWFILILLYVGIASITFIPVARAYNAKTHHRPQQSSSKAADQVEVVAPNRVDAIDNSPEFDDDEDTKRRLKLHYNRIDGALKVWKKMAEQNKKLHQYMLFWLTLAAALVPIMTQAIDGPISKLFLTLVSLHAAIILSFQRVLKPDQVYQAYRQSESEFYDLYRRILDNPESYGPDRKTQLQRYFAEVETVRKAARQREIREYFPTFDADQMANQLTNQMNGRPITNYIDARGSGVPSVNVPSIEPPANVVLPSGRSGGESSSAPAPTVNVSTTIVDNSGNAEGGASDNKDSTNPSASTGGMR